MHIIRLFLDPGNQIFVLDNKGLLYHYAEEKWQPFLIYVPDIKNCFKSHNDFYIVSNKRIEICNKKYLSKKTIAFTTEQCSIHTRKNSVLIDEYLVLGVCSKFYLFSIEMIRKAPKDSGFDYSEAIVTNSKIKQGNIVDLNVNHDNQLCLLIEHENAYHIENYAFDKEKKQIIPVGTHNLSINESITNVHNAFDDFVFSNTRRRLKIWRQDTALRLSFVSDDVDHTAKLHAVLTQYIEPDIDINVNVNGKSYSAQGKILDWHVTNSQQEWLLISDAANSKYRGSRLIDVVTGTEIAISESMIDYQNLMLSSRMQKLVIEVQGNSNVMQQVWNVMSAVFRHNPELVYVFRKRDKNLESYGAGTSRQILHEIKSELNHRLTSICDATDAEIMMYGFFIYFCCWVKKEHLDENTLKPYFYYLLCDKSHTQYLELLQRFRPNDYEKFRDQYWLYVSNPELLIATETDIFGVCVKTHHEFVMYLVTRDMTEAEMDTYHKLLAAYRNAQQKHEYVKIITKLPLSCQTYYLLPPSQQKIKLVFHNQTDFPASEFNKFKSKFQECFRELTIDKKRIFCQNVTGSQYYTGEVNIVLKKPDSTPPKEYEISTCDTVLQFMIPPSTLNIQNLISVLTSYDPFVKN